MKPVYSVSAPDQKRLKLARFEIEAVLQKHDLAGVVVLHTPGMVEHFYNLEPSYSCVSVDEAAQQLRIRSKLEDYNGETAQRDHDRVATANMTRSFADSLERASAMFEGLAAIVDRALNAAHTEQATFVPDPNERKM